MGLKVRKDGNWVNLEVNNIVSPDGLTGSWTNTNKQHNTFYTNSGSTLIYVSAVFRVRTINNESTSVTAGSNVTAWVSDPNETGTNLSNYNRICRVRDNGTADADNLYLNIKFFVPPSCKYICKLYKNNLNGWGNDSRVSTLSWVEFDIELKVPNDTFTSLDSNSNNFQRSAKAPSNAITNVSNWTDFMREFAVWHEPGNSETFEQSYSTTYTINITKAGDYTLEYAADDEGIWTFDGTQVASAVQSDETWKNDPPSFVTLSNVTIGSHTLVVTVTNDDLSSLGPNSNTWNNNPAGIAWRLKPYIQ